MLTFLMHGNECISESSFGILYENQGIDHHADGIHGKSGDAYSSSSLSKDVVVRSAEGTQNISPIVAFNNIVQLLVLKNDGASLEEAQRSLYLFETSASNVILSI